MSKILNIGETKTISASSKTYRGAQFTIVMQHATANTAFTAAALNLDNLRVAVRLMQAGKKYAICNDRASILFRESGFKTAAFDGCFNVTNWTTLVAAASGVKAKVSVTGFIDFGGSINLHKGDTLDLEATLNTGAFSTNVDSAASFLFALLLVLLLVLGFSLPIPLALYFWHKRRVLKIKLAQKNVFRYN